MNDSDIAVLEGMGFPKKDVIKALRAKSFKLDDALELLLSGDIHVDNELEGQHAEPAIQIVDPSKQIPNLKVKLARQASKNSNRSFPDSEPLRRSFSKKDSVLSGRRDSDLDRKVSDLISMGFSEEQARSALQQSQNNLDYAADFLLQDPDAFANNENKAAAAQPAASSDVKLQLASDDDESAIHFGDSIQLVSGEGLELVLVANEKFMHVEPIILNQFNEPVSPKSTVSINSQLENSLFVILNPLNLKDKSAVKIDSTVVFALLRDKKDTPKYISIEGDNLISVNRSGPIETFMKWTLQRHEKRSLVSRFLSENNLIYPLDHISLKSNLNSVLVSDSNSKCVGVPTAKVNSGYHSVWKLRLLEDRPSSDMLSIARNAAPSVYKSPPSQNRPSVAAKAPIPSASASNSKIDLWSVLRQNCRLAAIRLQKKVLDELDKKTKHDKDLIMQANKNNADKKECTMCWENLPDTVLLECGHICLCSDCAPIAKDCPLCRKEISRFIVQKR